MNTNPRPRRSSITKRRSSITDTNENTQSKQHTPAKVLVFTGKCSDIFKLTLEDCVEDCILEFPGENSIYVPKSKPIPTPNKQTSTLCWKEPNSNVYQTGKSQHQRRSVNHNNLPQIGGIRPSQTTSTATTRMRHQLVQQKFTFGENISAETTALPTINGQVQNSVITEPDSQHPHLFQEEASSRSPSPLHHRKLPSTPAYKSYRDRQKDYLLSDLVILGPEYFSHVFNLPRTSRHRVQTTPRQYSNTQQHYNKTAEKYNELDKIRQDLFHRYLWTQKPQVSCRIRPMSTYTRSTTFVI
jgi:hypothetical protein